MSGVQTYLKNAILMGGGVNPVNTNNPSQYNDRQLQYFDPESRQFIQEKIRYASDFVVAQVQGIDDSNPSAWGIYGMRMANVVRPSSAIQRHFDDYKQFLFESRKIEYVRPGTKIVAMGSTWLVTNPDNVSGASGSGICRRCNAVWNHLDYYGNIVSEPIVVENERANANDSDAQNSQLISKGYFNIICQYNDDTRQIDTNTRFILGSAAYRVTGYSDFEMEFTGDYSTVRLLSFSARYEEPNLVIDDMENHVAGGKTFVWDVSVNGPASLRVGTTAQLSVVSSRNNEIVTSSTEHPITYLWESSDESVLTVDNYGYVTAINEGSASVRVKLSQNETWHTNYFITVTESVDGVEFTGTVPNTLTAYESVTLTAAYFEDGAEQSVPLAWDFSNAAQGSYAANVADDGKSSTITCYQYSADPLTVTISYGGTASNANIALEGI